LLASRACWHQHLRIHTSTAASAAKSVEATHRGATC
jgi:hypothetical protein